MNEQQLVDDILHLLDWSDIVYVHPTGESPRAVVMNIHTYDWILNFIERHQEYPTVLESLVKDHAHLEPEP